MTFLLQPNRDRQNDICFFGECGFVASLYHQVGSLGNALYEGWGDTVVTDCHIDGLLSIQLESPIQTEQGSRETIGLSLDGKQTGPFLIHGADQKSKTI